MDWSVSIQPVVGLPATLAIRQLHARGTGMDSAGYRRDDLAGLAAWNRDFMVASPAPLLRTRQ